MHNLVRLLLRCKAKTYQLQVLPSDAFLLQESVDDVGCQEERFWHQLHHTEPVYSVLLEKA